MVKLRQRKGKGFSSGALVARNATLVRSSRAGALRKGSLKDMPGMPLDILFEVFGHMGPQELLNLSRSNKDFRGLLMDKSSARFWKAAWDNATDLPKCPSTLSEPAYASLCFDHYCQNCLKPRCQTTFWRCKVRFCNDCREELMTGPSSFPEFQIATFMQLIPCDSVFSGNNLLGYFALKTDVEAIRDSYIQLERADIAVFLRQRRQIMQEIDTFAARCGLWEQKMARMRADNIENSRALRLEQIIEKLTECGWEEDLEDMKRRSYTFLTKQIGVKRSEELTNHAWEKMKPSLVEAMEGYRRDRLFEQTKSVIYSKLVYMRWARKEFRAEAPDQVFPADGTFAMMPEVYEILIGKSGGTAHGREPFRALKPILPGIISRWRKDAEEKLNQRIREELGLPKTRRSGPKPTSLAAAYCYECTGCSTTLTYPEVLNHGCDLTEKHYGMGCEPLQGLATEELKAAFKSASVPLTVWSADVMKILVGVVRPMLLLCNKDPLKTTIEDMDKLDARFSCNHWCCNNPGISNYQSWRSAIHHLSDGYHKRWKKSEGEWERAAIEDPKLIKKLELVSAKESEKDHAKLSIWDCSHCSTSFRRGYAEFYTKRKLIKHLREHHKISNPSSADMMTTRNYPYPVYIVHENFEGELPVRVSKALEKKYGIRKKKDDASK